MKLSQLVNAISIVSVSIAINALQLFSSILPTPVADAVLYLSIAGDLNTFGVFTNGLWSAVSAAGAPDPGMFFAPLYPAFLSVLMGLSPEFAEFAGCVVAQVDQSDGALCPHISNVATFAQLALAVISATLVYVGAFIVCRSRVCAWLAMLLALGTGEYAYYAAQFMTENLTFPLFTVASIGLVCVWRRPGIALWGAVGFAFALLVLTRPSFLYLFYVVLLCQLVVFPVHDAPRFKTRFLYCFACLAGFGVAAGPWILRNWIVLDTAAVTAGYSSYILVQRVAFNAMSLQEWLVSFIYWLPDFGDKLAGQLFDAGVYRRLAFDGSDTFYQVGNTSLQEATLAAAGTPNAHLGYVIREYVFGQLPKHSMVTIALAWRGMWVAQYWGLVAIPVFILVLLAAVRRGWHEFVVFVLPAWFMLGFHAFVSVNVVRYNLILIPGLATAVAWGVWQTGEKATGFIHKIWNGKGRVGG